MTYCIMSDICSEDSFKLENVQVKVEALKTFRGMIE